MVLTGQWYYLDGRPRMHLIGGYRHTMILVDGPFADIWRHLAIHIVSITKAHLDGMLSTADAADVDRNIPVGERYLAVWMQHGLEIEVPPWNGKWRALIRIMLNALNAFIDSF